MAALFEHWEWKNKLFPMNPEAPDAGNWWRCANLGFLYVAKRDKKGRPVLIMNVERIIQNNVLIDDLIMFTNYFFSFVIEKLLVPGLVECWTMVVDLNNVGISNIPLNNVKAIISNGSKFFKGRMFRQYTINAGWVVRKAFGGISAFLDEFTQQKLNMLSEAKELLTHVDADNLEVKYGGRLPNINQNFFPPNMEIKGQHLFT